jgi:hypothetical protein
LVTTSAGAGGTGGGIGPAPPCPTDQSCPNDTCEVTRLPSGDGANPGEFVIAADGLTVTDTVTGLVWQRDSSTARPGCSGEDKTTCTWNEARDCCASLALDGFPGWRLPSVTELSSLVDFTRKKPSIDPTAFPNTPGNWFWTSTPEAWNGVKWYVQFSYGESDYLTVDYKLPVRCVRSEAVAPCDPATRFVVLDDGLVRDTVTGLEWQREGSTRAMNWTEAGTYCPPGLRLPTVKELRSILRHVRYLEAYGEPTIDLEVFPNTPQTEYWTSTRVADYPLQVWHVDFYFANSGVTNIHDQFGDGMGRVRCVR